MTICWAPKAKARPPKKRGTMNRGEADYSEHLEAQRRDGLISRWRFEALTFRLADDCRLTPDFMVLTTDGHIEFHDVKGTKRIRNKTGETTAGPWIEEDARIKLRVAAEQYPEFSFAAVYQVARGVWERKDY